MTEDVGISLCRIFMKIQEFRLGSIFPESLVLEVGLLHNLSPISAAARDPVLCDVTYFYFQYLDLGKYCTVLSGHDIA
jgi:hypothetical protein